MIVPSWLRFYFDARHQRWRQHDVPDGLDVSGIGYQWSCHFWRVWPLCLFFLGKPLTKHDRMLWRWSRRRHGLDGWLPKWWWRRWWWRCCIITWICQSRKDPQPDVIWILFLFAYQMLAKPRPGIEDSNPHTYKECILLFCFFCHLGFVTLPCQGQWRWWDFNIQEWPVDIIRDVSLGFSLSRITMKFNQGSSKPTSSSYRWV